MPATTNEFDGPAGLCQRLGSTVEDLTDLAMLLQDALIHKKIDEIWTLLARHEEKMALVDQIARLWNDIYQDSGLEEDQQVQSLRLKVQGQMVKLRSLERTNARLSRSYLAAVRKFMSSPGLNLAPKRTSYNAKGRFGSVGVSRLIKQSG